MTNEQLEKEERALYDGLSPYDFYHSGRELTPEKQKRYEELQCVGMINSILAYDWTGCHELPLVVYDKNYKMIISGFLPYTSEGVLEHDLRGLHPYLKQYVDKLGRQRVLELIQGQMDSVEKVQTNVYTDSEGCTYNSIIYKEG